MSAARKRRPKLPSMPPDMKAVVQEIRKTIRRERALGREVRHVSQPGGDGTLICRACGKKPGEITHKATAVFCRDVERDADGIEHLMTYWSFVELCPMCAVDEEAKERLLATFCTTWIRMS